MFPLPGVALHNIDWIVEPTVVFSAEADQRLASHLTRNIQRDGPRWRRLVRRVELIEPHVVEIGVAVSIQGEADTHRDGLGGHH